MTFLKSDLISKWLKENCDIIFISETHLCKGQQFKIDNFVEHHNAYSEYDAIKPRGGISCFISPLLVQYIDSIDTKSPEHIMIKFVSNDIIFGAYIPPTDSIYSNVDDFSTICNIMNSAGKDVSVIGGGDINSRVGDVKLKTPPGCSYRSNPDKVVNSNGKEILTVCDTFKCVIVNNLSTGDKELDGNFTFHKGGRKSQNDIVICNWSAIQSVCDFKIIQPEWNPSDHCLLSTIMDITIIDENVRLLASLDILTTSGEGYHRKPKKIHTTWTNWELYTAVTNYESDKLREDIEQLMTNPKLENVDTVVNKISNCIYNAASVSKIPRDTDIQINNMVEPIGTNVEIVDQLQNLVTEKELRSWSDIMQSKDSKELWSKINWNGSLAFQASSQLPELNDLVTHFEEKGKESDMSTLLCEVDGNNYVPELDHEITENEVEEATKRLKEGKSTGDGWVRNMITKLDYHFFTFITKLLMIIFNFHIFPTCWRTTVVNAIFKNKGLSKYAGNYRPVSLVQMLAKIFDFILSARFTRWFIPNDSQTAYQKGKSSADHVFLLRCLISYARKVKKKLFLIAIDFDGAFDRVCRSILIRKLVRFGAGTTFVLCLANIYMATDNIMYQGNCFSTYKLYSGIKQGLPLSPLLFLFYIDDIFAFFEGIYGLGISLLVHADDATLIAENRTLAVSKLRSLLYYCGLNKIIPQYKKCNFIVINGDNTDKISLPFGDALVKNIDFISLLGSHLSQTGNIRDDLRLHVSKRYSSCIKYYNFLKSNKLAPLYIKLKVLKACVVNSLLYNCETFGDCYPADLEKHYYKLIKATLQVRRSTPNALVLIETGLLPLKAIIYRRQFKFFKRFIESLDGTCSRFQVFNELRTNQTSYLKHYYDLNEKYSNASEIYDEFKEILYTSVKNFARVDGKTKFKTYLDINPTLTASQFLYSHCTAAVDITKFRLGSHRLPIETGRWSRIAREERICAGCGVVGDEQHVLFDCLLVNRNNLEITGDMQALWKSDNVYELFRRIKQGTEYL